MSFIGFRVTSDSVAANWYGVTDDGTTGIQTLDTGVSCAASTDFELEFLWTSGNVDFFIDGTYEGSLTSSFPNEPLRAQCTITTKENVAKALSVSRIVVSWDD